MNIATRMAVRAVRFYQRAISPAIGGRLRCRFVPTCSEYALQVLERWGIIRGSFMALRRILRCNPLGGSGYDPPPEKEEQVEERKPERPRGR